MLNHLSGKFVNTLEIVKTENCNSGFDKDLVLCRKMF